HGFVDARAYAPTAERDGAHLATGERAGRGERVGFGALLAILIGLIEPQRHLGQRTDGLVDFVAAFVDGVLGPGLLYGVEHLRQTVMRERAEVPARDRVIA